MIARCNLPSNMKSMWPTLTVEVKRVAHRAILLVDDQICLPILRGHILATQVSIAAAGAYDQRRDQ